MVAILLLVELILSLFEAVGVDPRVREVAILLLVELILSRGYKTPKVVETYCRNPSFSGTYSLTGPYNKVGDDNPCVAILLLVELILSHVVRTINGITLKGRNPSFSGTYSLTPDSKGGGCWAEGRNPSFSGTYSLTRRKKCRNGKKRESQSFF